MYQRAGLSVETGKGQRFDKWTCLKGAVLG